MPLCPGCGNYSGEVGDTCPMCGATIGLIIETHVRDAEIIWIMEQESVQDADKRSDGLEIQVTEGTRLPFGR